MRIDDRSSFAIAALFGGWIALTAATACTVDTDPAGDGAGPCDIEARLATVSGLTVVEHPSMLEGHRKRSRPDLG